MLVVGDEGEGTQNMALRVQEVLFNQAAGQSGVACQDSLHDGVVLIGLFSRRLAVLGGKLAVALSLIKKGSTTLQ